MINSSTEQGIISLLSAILLGLLMMVVTMSVITLESGQLRQEGDTEQSMRASYAAEAGIENGVAKVLNGQVTSNQVCGTSPVADTQNTNYDSSGQAGWTCQQIIFSAVPFGELKRPDEAVTVDPAGATGFQSVVIEWNDNATDVNFLDYDDADAFGPVGLPPCNEAADGSCPGYPYAAPPVELTTVQYPQGGFSSTCNCVYTRNALFVPHGDYANPTVSFAALGNRPGPGPIPGRCRTLQWTTPIGDQNFNCFAVLTNLDSAANGYLFRIRSRYSTTNYKLTFMSGPNGDGSPVAVPSGAAVIDVTANAGQEFRRVVSQLPLQKQTSGLLNYVLYSDTDVCKNLSAISGVPQPGGCPTFP
jgi:hypothetical protein